MNRVCGANGSRVSSVITVTRIQADGYETKKRGFSLALSLQVGTEAHIDFFCMGLQIKRPGRETDYYQCPSNKTRDQPAVTAVTVLIAVV